MTALHVGKDERRKSAAATAKRSVDSGFAGDAVQASRQAARGASIEAEPSPPQDEDAKQHISGATSQWQVLSIAPKYATVCVSVACEHVVGLRWAAQYEQRCAIVVTGGGGVYTYERGPSNTVATTPTVPPTMCTCKQPRKRVS